MRASVPRSIRARGADCDRFFLVRISFQIKRPSGAEDFDDEDDMAASCLLSLVQAAKEQQHSRASTQRASTQRAAVMAPEVFFPPVGSLFESLYEGLEVAGNAPEHPPVAGPGYGMAVQGLMQMWQESIENEKLIQELAGAVDVDGIQDRE